MKKNIKSIAIGVLVGISVLSVSAYNTQIWSPVQFVKQLFVTPNGELDTSKATIKIDGINGSISAKSLKVNGQEVATKGYVDSKVGNGLKFVKGNVRINGDITIQNTNNSNYPAIRDIHGRWLFGVGDLNHPSNSVISIGSSYKSDGQDIRFDAGFNGAMIIKKDSGNVGIGTNAPKAKLDVNGSAIINSLKIRNQYYVYSVRKTIYFVLPNGKEYKLNYDGLSQDKRHCSADDMICWYSPSNGGDAKLQLKMVNRNTSSCVLLHSDDDYASWSKGLYYASEDGNDCAVYPNKDEISCFKIGRDGQNKDVIHNRAEYKIVCF